jgi:phenylacetate-CoA ligase
MVFLRYENGDVATIGSRVNSDGVIQPVLKEILGREKDTIILKNGSPVHGVFFTDIFYELNNKSLNLISRFQVYQNNPGQIIFKIESKVAIPEDSLLLLKSSLEKFFNSVEIKIFDRLPVADSGKFKYIVSDIRNGQNIV